MEYSTQLFMLAETYLTIPVALLEIPFLALLYWNADTKPQYQMERTSFAISIVLQKIKIQC